MSGLAEKRLNCLVEFSRSLEGGEDFYRRLEAALGKLGYHLSADCAAISLYDKTKEEVRLEAAWGLSGQKMAHGGCRLGEGVIGQVVASGQPMVLPDLTKEPRFANHPEAQMAFICVPIKIPDQASGLGGVIGALWASLLPRPAQLLQADLEFLGLAASLLASSLAQLEAERLDEENRQLRSQLAARFSKANLIGQSAAMFQVFGLIDKVARSRTTVLLRGESGTGKGLVASAIHFASPRAQKPFIKVNCAALPESLIEAELFGYEKGAFTGALKAKPGKFELAEGGTIFLDEVGSLPLAAQAKLLRVLQERELERLGATRTTKVEVRVIAATNRNLEAALAEGAFREDLYYRLNVFPIHLPPLRERQADILLLVDHFIEKYSRQENKDVRKVAPAVIDRLLAYHWPGNVRELENVIERAVVLAEDKVIRLEHLPSSLQEVGPAVELTNLPQAVAELERRLIRAALAKTRGNLTRAAGLLGLTQRMIGYKIRKLKINPKAFAASSSSLKAGQRRSGPA